MKLPFLILTLLALANEASVRAATLADADSWWQFDGTASGSVTAGQIIDSSINSHSALSGASNISNLTWASVPTTGPAGGVSTGRGLKFSPYVVTKNTGSTADQFSASYFLSSGATVTGSSTLVTRLQWDGNLGDSDDGVNQWIVNNGLSGWNDTTRQSAGYLFGLTTGGALYYYTAGPGSGQTATGATHNFTTGSTINLAVGQWYDIAMVVTPSATDPLKGTVTFYAVGQDGVLKTYQLNGENTWINTASATNLVVGAESPGSVFTDPTTSQVHTGYGNGNNRKTFNGTMDYLAMFDTALTQQEIISIFAVPEPGRALLIMMAIGLMSLRHRRR